MLFGRVDTSLERLRERLSRMGAVTGEGDETHLVYVPLPEAGTEEDETSRSRTSALLHVYDNGKSRYACPARYPHHHRRRIVHYTPGDYGSGESTTTVMNMAEMVIESGEVSDLLALLDYQ